ncbi:MAG: hypothetical protein EOO92_04230 [Pedobacter sp.]|nr:MAG: hypothetical protein EOO92_04230 [Pedobacter sp.]
MKKALLILFLSFIFKLTFAQKGSISGTLLDSTNHKTTLNFATISVFKGTDSTMLTYKLSDDKGIFKITNLEAGVKYRLVINAWMYNVRRKEVVINTSQLNVDFGNIYLTEKVNNLDEVAILSERPPIIVRKDTIEFNAESFKTLPSAVVEDLLKKLPGVTMNTDGAITVNGKAVSKILVDGKEFFGGDQQIATKNLPANIIDKVQVTDDLEAKRRDPDIIAANTPQIINLKLKKAFKKGAFGKIYAGGGSNKLFEGGGLMNFFRDTTQVSILGYGNNANKPGFNISDIMRIGGFSRTGVNSMMINSEGGYAVNGVSFGGTMNGGIQQSAGTGINFNTITKSGTKINGKYFLGYIDNELEQLTAINQTIVDGSLFSNTNSLQNSRSYSHNVGARVETKIDSLTKLTIEPNVSINLSNNLGDLSTTTLDDSRSVINTGTNASTLKGNAADYNLASTLWKDFKKSGRNLNLSVNVVKRNNLNDNFNITQSNFFDPISTTFLDQWRNNNINNFNINLNANYNEPISKTLILNVVTNSNYINNENALATFIKNPNNQAYDIAIPNLTETVNQEGYKTNNRFSLRWKANENLSIQPGLVFNTINLNNTFVSADDFDQNFTFFAPQLTIRYKLLNFTYSPSFREPDVSYIQPVANNTNPLLIQNGNSSLRPSKTQQVNLSLNKYDTKNTLSYNLYLGGSVQNDGIVMERSIAANGVQTNTPTNQDGIWQFHTNGNISKDFKNTRRQFTVNASYWANYNRGIVIVNGVRSHSDIINGGPRVGGRLNLNDKLEFGQSYGFNLNKSFYSDSFFTNLNYYSHNSDTELIVRLPKKMVWETNYRWQYNTQTINGVDNSIVFWNAAITLLFTKNDKLQLKCSVNDILNTNNRRTIYINENTARDIRTNNLGRHGLMTLTYNIQNFGGKIGGRETLFRF